MTTDRMTVPLNSTRDDFLIDAEIFRMDDNNFASVTGADKELCSKRQRVVPSVTSW
jgi:hypothetical protein